MVRVNDDPAELERKGSRLLRDRSLFEFTPTMCHKRRLDRCGPDDRVAFKEYHKRGSAINKPGQRTRIDLSRARDKSDKCRFFRR